MVDLLNSGPDTNAPLVSTFSPANGATNIPVGVNLVATFNEGISRGTGNIRIKNLTDATQTTIAVTDVAQVGLSGTTLTINPTANLTPAKQYAIQIDAGAINDMATNSFAGITNDITWSFTTAVPDLTAPAILTFSPTNGSTNVLVVSDLVATFSEPIARGTGNLTITNLTDGTQTVIAVTDVAQISVSGAVLNINPTANLTPGKQYAIRIAAGAIKDLSDNPFAGVLNDSAWSFTTEPPDLTSPAIVNLTPANGATGVATDANLVLTFSEPVVIVEGDITLKNLTDATQTVIAITNDTLVSLTGNVLTINPADNLTVGKQYAVQIDAGAIDDLANNPFAGIANDSSWSFTVVPPSTGAVIYEPFADTNTTLTGNAPGIGVTTNWLGSGNVVAGNLSFGNFPAGSGNKASFSNQNGYAPVGTTLAEAGLLTDNATLWFSVLVQTGGDIGINGDLGFALGTDQIGTGNNIPVANSSQALGFTFKNGQLRASHWYSGGLNRSATNSANSAATNTVYLVVGKFIWGATNDTIEIYNVGTNLTLGVPVSTYTTNVNQALFDTISMGSKSATPAHLFDEIRFGSTYASVIGSGGGSASTNANLSSLVINPAGTLFPSFSVNQTNYIATNAYGVSPTITVTNADLAATNRLIYNGNTNLLASGVASSPLALTLGVANPVVVRVTAQDGVTVKTYMVNVTMLPSQAMPQMTNALSGGQLSLSWPGSHLGYRLQMKTNGLDSGAWIDVPGSASITSTNLPIDPNLPSIFYRLVYP
jgi:methionine-rich copper-binding protein CopC